MKDNRNNKAKIYMIFSLIVLVIAVIVSGTYAYYVWNTSDSEVTKIVAGVGAATVTFDGGSDISANLRPVSDKSKGIVKNISVKADTAGLVFNMYLDITSIDTGLKDESFRYELYKGDTKVKEGNFSDSYLTSNTVTCTKNNTNHIVLLTNESISTSKTSYTLYIWIDGANYTNPNTMMNKTFSFKLHADGEGAVLKGPTAAETITELYMNAEKETIQNNSIDYHIAPSVSLMNDRLGGTTTDLDGGNIRYYGASPDNYIYFNCETYPSTYYNWQSSNTQEHLNNPKSESECLTNFNNYYNCSTNYTELGFDNQTDCEKQLTENELNAGRQILCTGKGIKEPTNCELWRIIGVFNDKLKLIKNESIGAYSWDNKNTSTGAEEDYGENDWSTARLMKLLNPSNYYEVDTNDNGLGQSLYYNSASGKCYSSRDNATVDCDFTSTGIKNDTTRNMIAETTWNLGGWNTNKVYPNQIYEYERGTTVYTGIPTTWTGKIALAYPSDYGYAVDLNQCKDKTLYNYDNSTCTSNNWMKTIITNNGSDNGWLLTPSFNNAYSTWYVSPVSYVNITAAYNGSNNALVLYLNSDISIVGGTGTSSNPYLISK